jgi:hypothetical protein
MLSLDLAVQLVKNLNFFENQFLLSLRVLMRVLVTGGTSNLGMKLVQEFAPASVGVGRSNGWQLTSEIDRSRLVELSLSFDILLNYAYIDGVTQLEILRQVAARWESEEKAGLIVNFGSYLTYSSSLERQRSEYYRFKLELDRISAIWSKKGELGKVLFRVTNLKLGFLELPKSHDRPGFPGYGIDAPVLADVIRLAYRNRDFSFPELVLNIRQRYAAQ